MGFKSREFQSFWSHLVCLLCIISIFGLVGIKILNRAVVRMYGIGSALVLITELAVFFFSMLQTEIIQSYLLLSILSALLGGSAQLGAIASSMLLEAYLQPQLRSLFSSQSQNISRASSAKYYVSLASGERRRSWNIA